MEGNALYLGLGASIRAARKAKGMRLVELGEKVGLDNSSLSRIENDRQRVSSAQIAKIAVALGMPADYFTNLPGEPRPTAEPVTRAHGMGLRQPKIPDKLRPLLPEPLRHNAGVTLELLAYRYIVTYQSENVVVQAVQAGRIGSEHGDSPFLFIDHIYPRMLYRCMLFKTHLRDMPISNRHYLAAIIVPEGSALMFPQRPVKEAASLGLLLEPFRSLEELAERIVTLEKTPSEVDEVFADFEDDY